MEKPFNNEKYLELQSENILKRVEQYDNKLYLEVGGKLFDDYHASRVLPGFEIDTKLRMLSRLQDKVEFILAINSNDIEANKIRKDLNITYDNEVFRMIDRLTRRGFYVSSVVVTHLRDTISKTVSNFMKKLERHGVKVYKHYFIDTYPNDLSIVISENGFGRNEYVETSRPIVVVNAPGPGSGKMATCMSQLYNEFKRGVKAGYAKYETFPIWNLGLEHPVNLAYESATADLNDENMVDIYHEIAYGKRTTNYNRDIQAFPIVREMLTRIYGKSPYNSPTDMGVNMAGFAIEDDAKVQEASKQEIIRRLFDTKIDYANGTVEKSAIEKIEKIMRYLNLDVNDRDVYKAAIKREEETGQTSAAMQFEDGSIVTSKTSSLFGCASALILNALKHVSNISKEIDVLSISVLEPIQQMKVESLGHRNPHLHIDETLIALAISAQTSPVAKLVFDNLNKLNGAEAHFTCKLSKGDEQTLKRLKVNFTTEPDYEDNRLAND